MNKTLDDLFNKEIILQSEEQLPNLEKKWQLGINICDGLYLGSRISPYYLQQQVIPNYKWVTRYLDSHPLISEHTDIKCYSDGWNGDTPEYCRCFSEARRLGITNNCGLSFAINGQFSTRDEIFRFIYNLFYITIGEYLPWIMTLTTGNNEKTVLTAVDALDIAKLIGVENKFESVMSSLKHVKRDENGLEYYYEFIRDSFAK